jgi:uncharacterized membrane protein
MLIVFIITGDSRAPASAGDNLPPAYRVFLDSTLQEVMMRNGAASGLAFGVALAGFWDGITLHSILQWHHMISGWLPPTDMHGMQTNMLADGFFDFFCWLVTILGVVLLFRESRRGALMRGKSYFGWILIGGGLFNFVEGLIDHEILGLHHVHPGPNWLAWDIGFLVIGGIVLFAIGWMLKKEQSPASSVHLPRAA